MTDPTTRALLIAGMPTHDELLALLPGAYYMDPPDGGSVTVLEQLQRMALDAARYRLVRQRAGVECRDDVTDGYVVRFPREDLYRGINNQTLDAAVDAAMKG